MSKIKKLRPIQINDYAWAQHLYESTLLQEVFYARRRKKALKSVVKEIVSHVRDNGLVGDPDISVEDDERKEALQREMARLKRYWPEKDHILRAKK